jgi:transcriptional regulator with XRE-family HTH domain
MLPGAAGANRKPALLRDSGRVHPNSFFQQAYAFTAKRLGITFSASAGIRKGINRISASRLEAISSTMGVPISYFFPEPGAGERPEAQVGAARSLLESKNLLKGFAGIGSPAVRKAVRRLVEVIEEANYVAALPPKARPQRRARC